MGLAIIAYHDVTPWDELSEGVTDGRSPEEDGVRFSNDLVFATRLAPLKEGYYLALESHREHIGSYKYYGRWRNWLSLAFPSAFLELVDFSDCRGSLGPFAVRNLCADFEAWEDVVREFAIRTLPNADSVEPYVETYQQFRRCFLAAGSDGVVEFS